MHSTIPQPQPASRRRRFRGAGGALGARGARGALAAVGALAMAVGLAGVASPAHAAESDTTGSIAGTVTGEAGAPLEGVLVQLFHCTPDFDPFEQRDCWNLLWGEGQDAKTAADGTFSIDALEPGTYRAVVHPQSATAQYVSEYWDGSDTLEGATDIEVTAGGAASIAPVLEVGATVTGRVVDEAGAPVAGGFVYAYLSNDLNSTRGGTSVAADGSYTISGLPAGEYLLEAGPGWGSESELVDEYWQDAYSQDEATRVDLVAGQSFPADFELNAGGVIEGAVSGGGAPVEGLEVTATYDGASDRWVEPVTGVTAADGTYRLGGLEAGEYVVEFSDFDGAWAQQFWQGSSERAAATRLEVSPGDLVDGIDANLTAGGALAGTLTEGSGAASAASAAYFDVLRKDTDGAWQRITSDRADAAGAYEISGLAAGEYTVVSYGSSSGNWATTYHGGVYFGDEATEVTVAPDQVATGVDVQTAPGVSISGSVIDEHGGPAPGAYAQLLLEREPGVWVQPELFGGAGDDISFRMGGLPPGDYIVKFQDTSDAEAPYVTQYWEHAATQDAATVLEAPDGGEFTGINAVMTRTAPEPEPEPAPTPTLAGVAQVGQTLTAESGDWGAGAEIAYQWFADGAPVDGATGAEFVPADDHAGATLTVAVTGTRSGAAPETVTSAASAAVLPRFADVTTGGHAENVRWAGSAGVIDGVRGDDGIVRYDAKATATRATAAIALYRLAGSPAFEAPAAPTFADVPADHEAYTAVEYLASVGVAFGYGNGSFGPADTLKRQHLAAFLHRGSAPSFTAPGTASFTDVPVGSAYFTAIEWVAAERLTTVTGTFRPTATTSREELATFLARWNALEG
ncbi:carboxypeptidase regulatory-like domain-containing protein [Agromyces silvae]|uniref:carboxypeptidase regulatory-like domain-containing protein n=1 Tax=Agromyces silvae TaxID=3388266 RepID=UPI00280AC91E|nr:carboxypeptidase regulatory-like domain-containing protein [Agromyces protaetiae]